MLSRAATSLTLLGRHLERADHLARILGVHVALSLDRTDEPGPEFWIRFLELAGWPGSDTHSRDQAVEVVLAGTLGPSVRASVGAARLAAQAVRPSLPTELYEQVNALHWRIQEPTWQPDLYPFLSDVQLSIRLVDGLLEDTMRNDEARDFVRLGKFVERTANVTTIVTRKSGPAVLITYQAASAPNSVTGKTSQLAVERYEFWKNGREAIVTLSGPVGADNVDPWKIVTDSFTWK